MSKANKKFFRKLEQDKFVQCCAKGDVDSLQAFLDKPKAQGRIITQSVIRDGYAQACSLGKLNVVKFFINHSDQYVRIIPEQNDIETCYTGISRACLANQSLVVDYLLHQCDNKPDINSSRIKNCFLQACQSHSYQVIDVFINDLSFKISKDILSYLNGKNYLSYQYDDILEIINKRKLFTKLTEKLIIERVDSKKNKI